MQYLNRKPLREKPTAHISYHEGLGLIRQFLLYSSNHTVEDIQAFTGQWVPAPRWVHLDELIIPQTHLTRSAELLQAQLGHAGIDRIGGKTWWQWRRPDSPMKAEWIEMRVDYNKRAGAKPERIILYVHGGAYYFGSVDEHRYQMQRHARKLRARLLAPRYRLAPQFPFPCGLHDCIASYLYLLEDHHPSTILLGGDSAGGGMVLSMLVTLRDQGIPLPAGAFLLSPWCDLTHSFPSVAGDGELDYIPNHGFMHRPSSAWPPPTSEDMKLIAKGAVESLVNTEKKGSRAYGKDRDQKQKAHAAKEAQEEQEAIQGFAIHDMPAGRDEIAEPSNPATLTDPDFQAGNTIPGPGRDLSIELDSKLVELHDQIQMYTTNQLLAHPLVSPVLQPSLGGLPPLLIQTGGGELLHDEQVYLAHKAANPADYPPGEAALDLHDPDRTLVTKYPPTMVQLQVWDDLCHVPHTLSFTRPAKYMYRGVSQFGAWALAHAQEKTIEILNDDAISVISASSSGDDDQAEASQSASTTPMRAHQVATSTGSVGRAGDPLPNFKNHMIRQRVDRHGDIYPLAAASSIPALQLDPSSICVIKAGPVRRWLTRKANWDAKFAREKRTVQKQRVRELAQGFDVVGDEETPPPTALAGRRTKDIVADKAHKKGKSWGLAMWAGWGSKHDESTLQREEKGTLAGAERRTSVAVPVAGEGVDVVKRNGDVVATTAEPAPPVLDSGDSYTGSDGASERTGRTPVNALGMGAASSQSAVADSSDSLASYAPTLQGTKVPGTDNTFLSATSSRPHNGTVAYPFKLRSDLRHASTATLDSQRDSSSVGSNDDGGSVDAGVAKSEGGAAGHEWAVQAVQRLGISEGGSDGAGDGVGDALPQRPKLETFVTAAEF